MKSLSRFHVRRPMLAAGATFLFSLSAVSASAQVESAVANLEWRNIGPTIMGGRVADIAVVESNPSTFYVGVATGGVWKTVNGGTTWESLFDDQATSSIGDVTVAPSNPNIVWVGTGEPQNRQSSPWGNGVYKSTDAGRTWKHMGLDETLHISRIQISSSNPDVVFVAAVGHLWGANEERGVYRTTDGGATWDKVLYVDENTGAIDLAMDPGDPSTLFAAMYQRRRTGWGFNGGGPGSGIYRTTDGGASWEELTGGLPEGDMGRIGLDIYRGDGNVVYAVVEADPRDPTRGFRFGPPSTGEGQERKTGVYRSTDRGDTWERLSNTNNRPMYYSQVRIDPTDPDRIYLGGSRLYRSSDGGKTFTSDGAANVHSDHHALWIDPSNSNHLILAGDGGVSVSWDRSDHWRQLRNLPIAQFYEIGVDMRDPYYVCGGLQDNGSWCGPSATWSNQGIRPRDWYNVGGGDGFFTVIDPNDHTIVFGESQGGNLYRKNLTTMESIRMRPVGRPLDDDEDRDFRWNWNTPVVMSAHDNATIYLGGNVLFKSTDRGMSWSEMSPDLTKNIDRTTLEIMGVMGSDSMMSPNDGTSSYSNFVEIAESPLNASVLYVGTDDGNVQRTQDGGATWTDLTDNFKNVPDRTYVSRLEASKFVEGRVYATFDGHRNDDYKPYVFVSEDFGKRWRPIAKGLPDGWSVNVLVEHPRIPNLLFLGNEIGVYFTTDRGENWVRLKNNLPTVPVDDIKIHLRENDLVIGTHGRGIWIMPDITPLEQLSSDVLASASHLFPVRRATSFNPSTPQGWTPGVYAAPNPAYGALIRYYQSDDLQPMETPVAGDEPETNGQGPAVGRGFSRGTVSRGESTKAKITILDAAGETVRELEGSGKAGIQQIVWDLRIAPPYVSDAPQQGNFRFRGSPRGPKVLPGTYTVRLDAAGQTSTTDLVVRLDPRVTISDADLRARQEVLMSAHKLAKPVYEAGRAVRRINRQLADVRRLLKENDDAPQALKDQVKELGDEVREVGEQITQTARGGRGTFSIEASTTRPTADQEWQLEQAWTKVPGLIEKLNDIIGNRMPALYSDLDKHGIRPSPGKPVAVPKRR